MIVIRQQRQKKAGDGMLAEIRRDVANSQPAIGRRVVGVGLDKIL